MTHPENSNSDPALHEQSSLSCVIDAPELLRARVKPAEFARLLGVSKQCVSRWIAGGKVTTNPIDGRLDIQTAVQQVLRNTDPGRMRARVLRQAVADVQALRLAAATADERVAAIAAELAQARAETAYYQKWIDDSDAAFDVLLDIIALRAEELRTADSAEWREMLTDWHITAMEVVEGAVDLEENQAAAPADPAAADVLDTLRVIREREGGRGEVG